MKHKGEIEIVCNDIKGANLVQASLISLKTGSDWRGSELDE